MEDFDWALHARMMARPAKPPVPTLKQQLATNPVATVARLTFGSLVLAWAIATFAVCGVIAVGAIVHGHGSLYADQSVR